jgi:hypothetical protein
LPEVRSAIYGCATGSHTRASASAFGGEASIDGRHHIPWYFRLPDLQLDRFVVSGKQNGAVHGHKSYLFTYDNTLA